MNGFLSNDVLRMNARLHMGLPPVVQDSESGKLIATTDLFVRKVLFESPKHLRPISQPLADGLLILMGDKQAALDEIRLALDHARQIDEFQEKAQIPISQVNSWLEEEIKSAQWRSLISMLICHNIDWSAQFDAHGFGAQLLYQNVVWNEVQRRELGHLPVLKAEYLRHLPVELLTDVVQHTLSSVMGTASRIYRDQEPPPSTMSSFFRYGMQHIDESLNMMMIEVRRLHDTQIGRLPPGRLEKLDELIKKYFVNRNGTVAPNPAWHFKRFTTDIREFYSKRAQ